MTRFSLSLGAALIALAPGLAAAQSALDNPAVPGSGYRIPEVRTAQQSLQSANDADLSVPGDGYRAPELHTRSALQSAEDLDLSVPGDGYRIPDVTVAR
jgi:hypothetical protein